MLSNEIIYKSILSSLLGKNRRNITCNCRKSYYQICKLIYWKICIFHLYIRKCSWKWRWIPPCVQCYVPSSLTCVQCYILSSLTCSYLFLMFWSWLVAVTVCDWDALSLQIDGGLWNFPFIETWEVEKFPYWMESSIFTFAKHLTLHCMEVKLTLMRQ